MIALGAKMAKADGFDTGEVKAFRQVFRIPSGEESNAARVFNLARQDVTVMSFMQREFPLCLARGINTSRFVGRVISYCYSGQ